MLVVVCGLPGAGKSTVSRRIADTLDGHLLRTDVVRKELFPDPEYTAEESSSVYTEVLARARDRIAAREHVVLDGTFRRESLRNRVVSVATEASVPYRLVHVQCAESVVKERIAAREGDESDADFAVYELLKDEFEPIEQNHTVVDNSGSLEETRAQVDRCFAPTPTE